MDKVLITDSTYPDSLIEHAVLDPLGVELVDARLPPPLLPEAWLERLPEFSAVISSRMRFSAREIARLERCRILVRRGVGYDVVDLAAAAEFRLPVANVPDYGTEEVATHAFALLLAAVRRLDVFMAGVRKGDWRYSQAGQLHRLVGRTLGVVGYGRIGHALARRAPAFGLRVVACDPYAPVDDDVPRLGLGELLGAADYVSLHVPLTAETRRMIDATAFAAMRPGAVLVNTSRGPVVDPDALLDALGSGHLAAAACDVHDVEPLPADHPLLRAPNFLPTPHSAWYTEESMADMRRLALEEAVRGLRGERPRSWVNPEVGTSRLRADPHR